MKSKKLKDILREQRIKAGYSQTEASKILFIDRSTYNHFESGKRIPSVEALIRISTLYHINPIDLLYAMTPDETKNKHATYINYLKDGKYSLSHEELKFISDFNSLTKREKSAIFSFINILLDAHV